MSKGGVMSDAVVDFVRLLLESDWLLRQDEHIRIAEADASHLCQIPPTLGVLALIGDQLSPERWRLVLQLDPEDVTGLAEPSYRQAMAGTVVPANVMEWWHTKDASVVVSAEEDSSS